MALWRIIKPAGVDIEKFFKIVKAGFSHPRKQLINNLPDQQIKKALTQCHLNIKVRAQELKISHWATIAANDESL